MEEEFCPKPEGITIKTVLILITFIQRLGICFVMENKVFSCAIQKTPVAEVALLLRTNYRYNRLCINNEGRLSSVTAIFVC